MIKAAATRIQGQLHRYYQQITEANVAYTHSWQNERFDSWPKPQTLKTLKVVYTAAKARWKTLLVWVEGMPWLKTGGTHFYVQLGLSDKSIAIKGLDVSDFSTSKRYGPTLLSTVPWGINQ